jgi:protein required for attachment to host cells
MMNTPMNNTMNNTWILVADNGRARIFEMQSDTTMNELEDLTHALGRFQNRELKTDSEGRFFGNSAQGNTSEPDVSPEKHEATLFAKAISEFLTDSCSPQRYAKLIVFAEPQFLGLLRDKMDDQVRKLVVAELPKDLSKASVEDIRQHISTMHSTSISNG